MEKTYLMRRQKKSSDRMTDILAFDSIDDLFAFIRDSDEHEMCFYEINVVMKV